MKCILIYSILSLVYRLKGDLSFDLSPAPSKNSTNIASFLEDYKPTSNSFFKNSNQYYNNQKLPTALIKSNDRNDAAAKKKSETFNTSSLISNEVKQEKRLSAVSFDLDKFSSVKNNKLKKLDSF